MVTPMLQKSEDAQFESRERKMRLVTTWDDVCPEVKPDFVTNWEPYYGGNVRYELGTTWSHTRGRSSLDGVQMVIYCQGM